MKTGDAAIAVRDLLGPPLDVTKESGGTQWHYYKRVNTGDTVKFLGFVPWKGSNYWRSYEAVITIKAGVVESVKLRDWDE